MTEENLTAKERDFVRREFGYGFAGSRSLHDGIIVKRWATGPRKGQPKPVAAVQSMLDRGLLSLVDEGGYWLRAQFTAAGLVALQRMASDRRALPPEQFADLLHQIHATAHALPSRKSSCPAD